MLRSGYVTQRKVLGSIPYTKKKKSKNGYFTNLSFSSPTNNNIKVTLYLHNIFVIIMHLFNKD